METEIEDIKKFSQKESGKRLTGVFLEANNNASLHLINNNCSKAEYFQNQSKSVL